MKKLPYLIFIFLISSCSSNQEPEILKDIQTSYIESSSFSIEIGQRYFNMIENEWMLNPSKIDSYYRQALKIDSFATDFYNYVGAITTEHYQNEIDNAHNHRFTYADLLKKYRQVSDSINKYSFYDRDDDVKQIITNSTLPKDKPNEKVFLYAIVMQNDIAMGTTKSFISIYENLSDYHCGFDKAVITIKEHPISANHSFSFTLESESLAKQSVEKRFSQIDSVIYNNHPIKLSIKKTPIYEFTGFRIDSLKKGNYIIYGGVKVYHALGQTRYYPFVHQMDIAK